jgi:branched-chain amino acid transport system substrate-binding protein
MKNTRHALKILSGAVLALALAAPAVTPAAAEDSIYVPLFTYRTGPFGGSGTPIADGMHDYLTMLNERDGGIGGVKLIVDECETSNAMTPSNPRILSWSIPGRRALRCR